MFWNNLQIKKIYSQAYDREVLRVEDSEGNWRLLTETDLEKIKEEIAATDNKLNLILDHLKLKYVPETEKKEPAKLVEKNAFNLPLDYHRLIAGMTAYNYVTDDNKGVSVKPKRKYTKRKKSKKTK